MDGPQSIVWQQAENRLHIQKAILEWLLGEEKGRDQKIERGLKDVKEGRVLSQKEVERRIAKWQ